MAGRYVGFDRLKGELAKRPGVKDPAALAASIGRKKYGAKRMSATPDQQDRAADARQRDRVAALNQPVGRNKRVLGDQRKTPRFS